MSLEMTDSVVKRADLQISKWLADERRALREYADKKVTERQAKISWFFSNFPKHQIKIGRRDLGAFYFRNITGFKKISDKELEWAVAELDKEMKQRGLK